MKKKDVHNSNELSEENNKMTEILDGTNHDSSINIDVEELTEEQKEQIKKKKTLKRKMRVGIAVALMVIGVFLCLIPVYTNVRTNQFQKRNKEKFEQLVKENKKKLDMSNQQTEDDTEVNTEDETEVSDVTVINGNETNSEENTILAAAVDDILMDEELANLIGDGGFTENGPSELTDQMEQYGDAIYDSQKLIGMIEIDKIDVNYVIAEGWTRQNICVTIGHMTESSGVGEYGNCVLAGHRGGIYGEFFKNIDKLENGDKIRLIDVYGIEYVYVVYDSFLTSPDDMSVTENVANESTLTLVSCEDNAKKRLIVHAKQELTDEEISVMKQAYEKKKAAEQKKLEEKLAKEREKALKKAKEETSNQTSDGAALNSESESGEEADAGEVKSSDE